MCEIDLYQFVPTACLSYVVGIFTNFSCTYNQQLRGATSSRVHLRLSQGLAAAWECVIKDSF